MKQIPSDETRKAFVPVEGTLFNGIAEERKTDMASGKSKIDGVAL